MFQTDKVIQKMITSSYCYIRWSYKILNHGVYLSFHSTAHESCETSLFHMTLLKRPRLKLNVSSKHTSIHIT